MWFYSTCHNFYTASFATTGTCNAIVSAGHVAQAEGLCALQPRPATQTSSVLCPTQSWQSFMLSRCGICWILYLKRLTRYCVSLLVVGGAIFSNFSLLWGWCPGMPQTTGSLKIILMWQALGSSKELSPPLESACVLLRPLAGWQHIAHLPWLA